VSVQAELEHDSIAGDYPGCSHGAGDLEDPGAAAVVNSDARFADIAAANNYWR